MDFRFSGQSDLNSRVFHVFDLSCFPSDLFLLRPYLPVLILTPLRHCLPFILSISHFMLGFSYAYALAASEVAETSVRKCKIKRHNDKMCNIFALQ